MDYEEKDKVYQDLAVAIVAQACQDYINSYISEESFKEFLYSGWYAILTDINPKLLFKEVHDIKFSKLRRRLFKSFIGGKDYGKK